ncbi:hypothetical protein JB92DRAFT_2824569 [Gautieria morchelliformis]|nr:hypothetical protein JB92DRAFT_2824569 [Gautieria morchelliformis]
MKVVIPVKESGTGAKAPIQDSKMESSMREVFRDEWVGYDIWGWGYMRRSVCAARGLMCRVLREIVYVIERIRREGNVFGMENRKNERKNVCDGLAIDLFLGSVHLGPRLYLGSGMGQRVIVSAACPRVDRIGLTLFWDGPAGTCHDLSGPYLPFPAAA